MLALRKSFSTEKKIHTEKILGAEKFRQRIFMAVGENGRGYREGVKNWKGRFRRRVVRT